MRYRRMSGTDIASRYKEHRKERHELFEKNDHIEDTREETEQNLSGQRTSTMADVK